MKIGVSTACLYPMEIEKAFQTLNELGFRTFECFINTYSELTPSFLRTLRDMMTAYGSHVRSVHPFSSGFETFMLFSDYKRRFWDTLEQYKAFFEAARFLGADLFVIHGDRRSVITEEEYFSRFSNLVACGRSYGVTVAQENVNLYRSADPGFIRRMRMALGKDARFVLDLKQAVRAGWSPFDLCEAMGEDLIHVHVNDHLPGQDCLLPGKGAMDYNRLGRVLRQNGFSGDYILELYRENFGDPAELAQSARWLESVLSAV